MAVYRVAKAIGRGGMGHVALAMQRGMGGFERLVVLKRLHAEHLESEASVAMFLDEARLTASLSHPNIVQILDIDRDEEGPYIAMEYLPGETLQALQKLRHGGTRVPLPVLARIFIDVAQALHHAHSATDANGAPRGIVHRDVSPSNVIVCFNGHSKLLDFGVAKAAENVWKTQAGTLKGKLRYLAPEQVNGSSVDARADLFQLGIVLHETLTGRPLFQATDLLSAVKAVARQPIPRPSALSPEVPAELDAVVMRALERDRQRRFPDARAFAQALELAVSPSGGVASADGVATWLREVFAARIELKARVEREVRRAPQPLQNDLPAVPVVEAAVEQAQVPLTGAPSQPAADHSTARMRPPPLPTGERLASGRVVTALREPLNELPASHAHCLGDCHHQRPRTWVPPLVAATISGLATAGGVLGLALILLRPATSPDEAGQGEAAVRAQVVAEEVTAGARETASPPSPGGEGERSRPAVNRARRESKDPRGEPAGRPLVKPHGSGAELRLIPAAKFDDDGPQTSLPEDFFSGTDRGPRERSAAFRR